MIKDKTFWSKKSGELVELLNKDIPFHGKVKNKNRPMLEEWRKLSNVYYDYYNNGNSFFNRLRHMAKRMNYNLNGWSESSLEGLADIVFEKALIEKLKG